MNDLIKVVQKCIDRIYNHLLVYVETEFHRKFGLFSPSVTGIDEAISRVKNSKTGKCKCVISLDQPRPKTLGPAEFNEQHFVVNPHPSGLPSLPRIHYSPVL